MVLSGGRLAKETNNDSGVKDFTVTPITDEDDKIHNAQDVVQRNEEGKVLGGTTPAKVSDHLIASTTEYDQTGLVDNVLTIASSNGFYLKNDGTSDFTITIGTFTFTIKPEEVRCIELETAFTTITFQAGAVFRGFGVKRV